MKYAPIVAKMAFRNVLKYGRRSAETFAVIFAGVAAIAVADAFLNGFADKVVAEYAVAGGHLRVAATGYAARRATCPLDRLVQDPAALAAEAERSARAAGEPGRFAGVAASPLLRAPCAVQLGERSVNLYAAGADPSLPDDGLAPAFRASAIAQGRYPGPGERGVALSAKAAAKLGANVGDSVVILASDAFGSFGALELPLLGIARADPGPEACLVSLDAMRELVGVPSGASEVSLYLVDGRGSPVDPRSAPAAVRAMRDAAEAAGLEAEAWDDDSQAAAGMLALFDGFAVAMYAIFALVAGAGIANSVLLSVQDRTRDFATLRAVAFSAGWVKAIVALETLIIGAAASIAAVGAAGLVIAAMGPEGLVIPQAIRGIAAWMPQRVAARPDPAAWALIVAGGCALPLASAAYPLWILGRMKIREALGYI